PRNGPELLYRARATSHMTGFIDTFTLGGPGPEPRCSPNCARFAGIRQSGPVRTDVAAQA
ncbi:hypothetical protein, partial [Burkholderia multivorans]|uniref:hypothetical protein n=1 Tax=Burkholderia multivorans TaxID=87883 RepID=UPI001C654B56